jgi:uncharacterized YccA/Bax inhibitor family protein
MTAPGELASGNPAFTASFVEHHLLVAAPRRTMSVPGIGVKTLFLLCIVIVGGSWGWAAATTDVPPELGSGVGDTTVVIPGGFWLASLGAFFMGLFVSVVPARAALLGPVYAVLQGYCLGAMSAAFDAQTDGIVGAAVLSTICVFTVALLLYVTRLVQPSQKLAFAVIAGIGGLALLYLFVFVMSIFDWAWLYSDELRAWGVVITLITVVLAALSLVLDFGTIERGVDAGASKELEWYLAFGLMVTLIWLYVTILRLIALLSRNR